MLREAPITLLFAIALLVSLPTLGVAQTIVGIVTDGPEARSRAGISIADLEQEVQDLLGGEFQVEFPEDKRLDGGWDLAGVQEALRRQLEDPEVDVLITTGLVASNEVARIENLTKPIIAAFTADSELQEMPVRIESGSSGKNNLVYISNFRTIDEEVLSFYETMAGFDHFVALVDRMTLDSIPRLAREKAQQLEQQLDIRITIVPVTDSVEETLAAIPTDADSVYVTPLLRLGDDAMVRLAQGFIDRGLPSFSLAGRGELEYGILMATGGREEDNVRRTRRLALNLQRILLGENPADMEVVFQE